MADINVQVTTPTVKLSLTGAPGPQGTPGQVGGVAIRYTFDTATADADPGSGKLRLSSATQNAATVIRADLADRFGADWTAALDVLDASSSAVKGQLRLARENDPTAWILFNLTARATATGHRNLTVVPLASSATSPFAANDSVILSFARSGDVGSGSLLAANNLSDLASATTARTNLGLTIGSATGNVRTVATGTVLQKVLATDAGSSTTATSLANLNVGVISITPKSATSRLEVTVRFTGSSAPLSGVNSIATFHLYDVTNAADIGSDWTLSASNGAGGTGVTMPCAVTAIITNAVTTQRQFELRAKTNNSGSAAAASGMNWSIEEVAN